LTRVADVIAVDVFLERIGYSRTVVEWVRNFIAVGVRGSCSNETGFTRHPFAEGRAVLIAPAASVNSADMILADALDALPGADEDRCADHRSRERIDHRDEALAASCAFVAVGIALTDPDLIALQLLA
jgi:hypothetical protein